LEEVGSSVADIFCLLANLLLLSPSLSIGYSAHFLLDNREKKSGANFQVNFFCFYIKAFEDKKFSSRKIKRPTLMMHAYILKREKKDKEKE
jgi:hypothetical protein